ncbi:MAG: glutamate-1-semialdehyde 2,1-aminomutase [Candidatus Omnitrophica bacterium]|nr:glutamate-1-semialdehyde 2,1-aminomutase [Candidatus Omnitrophota bacterium]
MSKSSELFEMANALIPGGVNSPVRAWKAMGGDPFFVVRGKGCTLTDEDGKIYLDYVGSWGPMILGHAHSEVVAAVEEAARDGLSFGAPTRREVDLARMIVEAVPSIEKVRLVNSGTEATLSAIRLARAYTKRSKIIKTIGGYHGHHDALLAAAGSGVATLAIPSTPGVPDSVVQDTVLVPYNDIDAARDAFARHDGEIAAVMVEPIAGNMGVVPPQPGYLETLRVLCTEHESILIFDEVMTGFRVAYGGAQELYGVLPDLTTLGKIIGGGLPIGAYGGSHEIMKRVAPEGDVYQAGTLSGNPVATASGIATLQLLRSSGFYEELEKKAQKLMRGFQKGADDAGVPIQINSVGSMMTVFFTDKPVVDFASAGAADGKRYAKFWRSMLDQGIYLPPSPFEAFFLSISHSNRDLDRTINNAALAFKSLSE